MNLYIIADSDTINDVQFKDSREIAEYLMQHYFNTSYEVSINDSLYFGVGTESYMFTNEVPATVSAAVDTRNNTFSNLIPGTDNLSAAIDAIYERDEDLILYAEFSPAA